VAASRIGGTKLTVASIARSFDEASIVEPAWVAKATQVTGTLLKEHATGRHYHKGIFSAKAALWAKESMGIATYR
jgi:hypothetical protein